jgi:hypothetical protein
MMNSVLFRRATIDHGIQQSVNGSPKNFVHGNNSAALDLRVSSNERTHEMNHVHNTAETRQLTDESVMLEIENT